MVRGIVLLMIAIGAVHIPVGIWYAVANGMEVSSQGLQHLLTACLSVGLGCLGVVLGLVVINWKFICEVFRATVRPSRLRD
jgi:hypothetical protein